MTVATTIASIVWGVRDIPRAMEFWMSVLDYVPRDEPSEGWVVLKPRNGVGPQLDLNRVERAPEGRRRHHLDLYSTDREAEIERFLALGATRADWRYEENADYIVLADPDGNLFCVIQRD